MGIPIRRPVVHCLNVKFPKHPNGGMAVFLLGRRHRLFWRKCVFLAPAWGACVACFGSTTQTGPAFAFRSPATPPRRTSIARWTPCPKCLTRLRRALWVDLRCTSCHFRTLPRCQPTEFFTA